MINILCVCANGMGTSTMLKITLKKLCEKNKIDADVESCSLGESLSFLMNTDLVITTPSWAGIVRENFKGVIAETQNLIKKEVIEEVLIKAVKENFPNEISQ